MCVYATLCRFCSSASPCWPRSTHVVGGAALTHPTFTFQQTKNSDCEPSIHTHTHAHKGKEGERLAWCLPWKSSSFTSIMDSRLPSSWPRRCIFHGDGGILWVNVSSGHGAESSGPAQTPPARLQRARKHKVSPFCVCVCVCLSLRVCVCVLGSKSLMQLFFNRTGPEIFTSGPGRLADAHQIVNTCYTWWQSSSNTLATANSDASANRFKVNGASSTVLWQRHTKTLRIIVRTDRTHDEQPGWVLCLLHLLPTCFLEVITGRCTIKLSQSFSNTDWPCLTL